MFFFKISIAKMVFTPEQDACILMFHYRSGTRDADGNWQYSLQSCMDQFAERFPDADIPYDTFVHHRHIIIHRFEEKHCICKGKSTGRPTKLTEEVVDDIQQRMERSPHKSIAKLASQTGMDNFILRIKLFNQQYFLGLSVGTCHKAVTKNLHMFPYKVSVVQRLLPLDFEKRMRFCQWFNENLNNDDILDLTFFSDEAWFHLSGYVNSQNYRTWGTENPYQFVETSLHPIKVGIWVAMSRRRIIGPIFFNENVTAERYRGILSQFIDEIHDDELQHGFFQQDGATAHTARETIRYLQEFYDDRIISQNLWPPRSPDLTPLDFYLFGNLKNKIFKNRLHNLNELQEAIVQEISNITQDELQRVFNNLKRRVNICLENNGQHFQHLL